jgi:membrane-bound lytic murein transglycosylase D
LKINRYVDERLDPIRATEAAAQLFKDNYEALGSWPLTVTSYNHGRNGMLRAKRQYGDDLRKIVDNYKSRYFGFASKNFYAEFLAALEVSRNYESYFGPLEIAPPLRYESVVLKRSYDSSYLTTVPGLSKELLEDYNPHLRRILASGRSRVVPARATIRVPVGHRDAVETTLASAKAASGEVMVAADGSTRYRVQHGDALGEIASQFGTTTRRIQALNGVSNPNRIYPGQVLLVSQGSGGSSKSTSSSDSKTAGIPQTYTVRRGDNLTSISKKFGVQASDLKRANRISNPNKIYPGMKLNIPAGGTPTHYVVRKGDTLARIARRFGSSINEIQHANGLRNPNRIHRGQQLLIP